MFKKISKKHKKFCFSFFFNCNCSRDYIPFRRFERPSAPSSPPLSHRCFSYSTAVLPAFLNFPSATCISLRRYSSHLPGADVPLGLDGRAPRKTKWHRYFGLATVFTLSRVDGLLIEVLGLRGCGRRQVPTCACRINLQLHSRPLSPVLASTSSSPSSSLVSFYFSPTALSSFHRHPLLLRSFPRPPLPLPVLTTLDSDYYISFCLSYSSHLALHFVLSLFSYFSHKHRISLRLPLSHFRSSSLVSILIEIAPSPRVVGLAPRDGLLLSSYVIWRDRNYIHRRDSLHAFIPEERKSIDSHRPLSLSLPSPLTSDSFINSLTVILSSSRHLPLIVRFFPSASCIVASRRF